MEPFLLLVETIFLNYQQFIKILRLFLTFFQPIVYFSLFTIFLAIYPSFIYFYHNFLTTKIRFVSFDKIVFYHDLLFVAFTTFFVVGF